MVAHRIRKYYPIFAYFYQFFVMMKKALPIRAAPFAYFVALSAKVLLTTLSNGAGAESSPASAITFCSSVNDSSVIVGVSQKAPIF